LTQSCNYLHPENEKWFDLSAHTERLQGNIIRIWNGAASNIGIVLICADSKYSS
jgi:hypothetical protein